MPAERPETRTTSPRGNDNSIQEDRYFSTYSAYFARFIQEYARQGINISMVMLRRV